MPRSTFVGLRCLRSQAKQRPCFSGWANNSRTQLRALPWKNGHTQKISDGSLNWHLLQGQKKVPLLWDVVDFRIKVREGLRLAPQPSAVKMSYGGSLIAQETRYLMGAPIFLAPIITFLKSSLVIKASASLVAFVKSTFVAKVFASAIAYFKSGTVFKIISTIGRVSLSIVPALRLLARRLLRLWHGSEYIEKQHAEWKASGNKKHAPHFRRTTLVLLSFPLILFSIAILASLERTPVWGRWRVIMMSTDEEARMLEEFLRPGSVSGAHLDTTKARDWLEILRVACGEENSPPGTLQGMPVLNPNVDQRARWVTEVFALLEDGVKRLNLTSEHVRDGCNILNVGSTRFVAPPVDYPLAVRPAALQHHGRSKDEHVEGPLITRYGCLIVDSPICNAFSLGFGPALQTESNQYEEAPGVVVVFTGLIDEILRYTKRSSEQNQQSPPANNAFFGVFRQAASASQNSTASLDSTRTKQETDLLASILAHELGHLLLSHSLESLASDSLYELLGTFATDIIRTVLYPLTAFLGPAFNDWFGEQIRMNSALGLRLTSSCAHRRAEIEADLVGLRILLGAGIDPRVALDDWAVGGLFDRVEKERHETAEASAQGTAGGVEEESWLDKTGFTRSHPMNEERFRRIAEELARWELLGKDLAAESNRVRVERDVGKSALTVSEVNRPTTNGT